MIQAIAGVLIGRGHPHVNPLGQLFSLIIGGTLRNLRRISCSRIIAFRPSAKDESSLAIVHGPGKIGFVAMSRSATSTSSVDVVLSLTAIPEALTKREKLNDGDRVVFAPAKLNQSDRSKATVQETS